MFGAGSRQTFSENVHDPSKYFSKSVAAAINGHQRNSNRAFWMFRLRLNDFCFLLQSQASVYISRGPAVLGKSPNGRTVNGKPPVTDKEIAHLFCDACVCVEGLECIFSWSWSSYRVNRMHAVSSLTSGISIRKAKLVSTCSMFHHQREHGAVFILLRSKNGSSKQQNCNQINSVHWNGACASSRYKQLPTKSASFFVSRSISWSLQQKASWVGCQDVVKAALGSRGRLSLVTCDTLECIFLSCCVIDWLFNWALMNSVALLLQRCKPGLSTPACRLWVRSPMGPPGCFWKFSMGSSIGKVIHRSVIGIHWIDSRLACSAH